MHTGDLAAQRTEGFKEAQRVAFIVVFAPDHVYPYVVRIVCNEPVQNFKNFFCVRKEPYQGELEAHFNPSGLGVSLC